MIENYIPKGHRNAVSRSYLSSVTGLSDRLVKREIEESEELICNIGEGYFRYLDESDLPYIREYIRKEDARKRTLSGKIRKLTKKYGELEHGK